jgi:hypothetical protein
MPKSPSKPTKPISPHQPVLPLLVVVVVVPVVVVPPTGEAAGEAAVVAAGLTPALGAYVCANAADGIVASAPANTALSAALPSAVFIKILSFESKPDVALLTRSAEQEQQVRCLLSPERAVPDEDV